MQRQDAELYYLKYIASQVSKLNLDENAIINEKKKKKEKEKVNDNNDAVADVIESLWRLYKELLEKHCVQNEKKEDSNTFSLVSVTLMTSEIIVKQLKANMTVRQSKLLFKRHVKLSPK